MRKMLTHLDTKVVKDHCQKSGINGGMGYAERLQAALDAAGKNRSDLAREIGCTRQAVSLVMTDPEGKRTLSMDLHIKAAQSLGVDPVWLASGEGQMNVSSQLSSAALDIATLYDLIPVKDRIRRARAYNAASGAILDVLHELPEIAQAVAVKKTTGV